MYLNWWCQHNGCPFFSRGVLVLCSITSKMKDLNLSLMLYLKSLKNIFIVLLESYSYWHTLKREHSFPFHLSNILGIWISLPYSNFLGGGRVQELESELRTSFLQSRQSTTLAIHPGHFPLVNLEMGVSQTIYLRYCLTDLLNFSL
jgi:hypothetical protein